MMVVTTAAASRITRTGVPYFCHFGVGGGAGACSCCAADMGAGVVTEDVKTGFSIADMAPLIAPCSNCASKLDIPETVRHPFCFQCKVDMRAPGTTEGHRYRRLLMQR